MKSKICTICKEEKSLDDFYRYCNKKYYFSYCKLCMLEYQKNPERREKKRKIDREYQRRKRKNNPGFKTIEYYKYCKKYPKRVMAQQILNRAIRKGILKRQPCVECGEKIVHGHHPSYSEPLNVKWLCPVHHKKYHLINHD